MASKSKKSSKSGKLGKLGNSGSESKRAPARKTPAASASAVAGARARRSEKTTLKAGPKTRDQKSRDDKARDKDKKRPVRTSKAPLGLRSSGRVDSLSGGGARSSQVAPDAKKRRQTADSLEAAKAAIDSALDKKALLPVLIDVSALASYTDFIAIVSGRSDRQVDAIADGILATMKARGRSLLGQEGSGSGRWTLLDFGDVVVHVFYHPVREFYDLESLWVDAPRIQLRIPPEAVMAQPDALYGNL